MRQPDRIRQIIATDRVTEPRDRRNIQQNGRVPPTGCKPLNWKKSPFRKYKLLMGILIHKINDGDPSRFTFNNRRNAALVFTYMRDDKDQSAYNQLMISVNTPAENSPERQSPETRAQHKLYQRGLSQFYRSNEKGLDRFDFSPEHFALHYLDDEISDCFDHPLVNASRADRKRITIEINEIRKRA